MKKLFSILAFLFVLCLCGQAWGATYTVNQSGSGADYSIAQFNALTGDKGGNTYNFSGTITTNPIIAIYGSSGTGFVILDGGSYNAIADTGTHAVIQGRFAGTITQKDYIKILDFEFDGQDAEDKAFETDRCNYWEIKDCYFHDYKIAGFWATSTGYWYGDYGYWTVGGASGDGCRFQDIGAPWSAASADAIFGYATDVIVSYNKFLKGTNGTTPPQFQECLNVLFEYNYIDAHTTEAGPAFKAVRYGIYRFNYAPATYHDALHISHTSTTPAMNNRYIYVFGNLMAGSTDQGILGWVENDLYIWGNIIYDSDDAGIGISVLYTTSQDIYIFNNTLVDNADGNCADGSSDSFFWDCGGIHIRATHSGDRLIKNNLLYNNATSGCSGACDNDQITIQYSTGWTETDNVVASGSSDFTDYASDDFTLASTASTVIDQGNATLGVASNTILNTTITGADQTSTVILRLNEILDPRTTDHTTWPPTVTTALQGDYGSGWEVGAFVFVGETEDPPTEDNIYLFNTADCFAQDGAGTEDLTGLGGNEQCSAVAKKEGDASLLLDGTGDGAYIADANWTGPMANSGATDAFTICGWVYVNDEANEQWITAKGSGATSAPWILYLDAGAGEADYFKWASYNGGWCGTPAASDVDVDAANWYHICVASDDTDNGDGTFSMLMRIHDVSSLIDNETGSCTAAKNAQAVTVGYNPNGPAAYWNGRIDDLRYYSYAMTADQMDSAWGSALASLGPTNLTSAAALTSAGDWTLTLVKDTEGFVSGNQPYFDLPLDYPSTTRRMYRTGKGGTSDMSTYFTGTFLVGDQLTSVQTNVDTVDASDDITIPGTWTDAQNTTITVTNCLTGLDSYPAHSVAIPNTSDDPLDIAASGGDATTLAAALAAGYELVNGDYILYASGTYADVINTAGAAGATIYFNKSTITGAGTWDVDCTVDGSAQ